MARNGSGTFIRLYNWEQDAANNIRIRADRMDNEMDGMADALTGSIASDGQTPITANLPMSGFKHTNVADASQRNQYATWGQAQDNTAQWGGTDTGTADAYEITTTPVTTSYVTGQTFRFKVGEGHTNTGAATLSVNGLNPRDLKDQDGNDPVAGAIREGALYEAVYDGTDFIFSGYLSGTSFGSILIATDDAAAARATLELSDSDTPNFDGVELQNNEIGNLTGGGTIFWDASHGMYQVDNTNTAHLLWSSQAVTEGDGISITYNGTTDQPTLALDGTYDGSDIFTENDADQRAASAWVNFNGNNTSIRDSYNVDSITDNGVGDYTINFETNMDNSNYTAVATTTGDATGTSNLRVGSGNTTRNYSTSSVRLLTFSVTDSYVPNDVSIASVNVFGGKN